MKNLTFIFIFFLVVPGLRIKAQEHQEGIFFSSADFNNNKISYSNPEGKKYKFYLHNSFNTPIRIITGDSVKTISKKSVFGYRDEKGTCYRYYDKSSFEDPLIHQKVSFFTKRLRSRAPSEIYGWSPVITSAAMPHHPCMI